MSSRFYNSYDFPFIYQRLFFQKEGKQIANRVNDSNRPKSMAVEIIVWVYADMPDQVQVAPNWPNAGPVLLIAAMERPNASEMEIYPSIVSKRAQIKIAPI